jgi:uroporphyrinogen decarboxylase
MDSRERVFTALHHEEPDRIPRFNWFSPKVSGELRKVLGIPDVDPRRLDIELGHDWVVEFVGVTSPWVSQVNDPSMVPRDGAIFRDAWGITYEGLREDDGGSYPAIIQHPLAEANDLSEYTFPTIQKDVNLEGFRRVVERYGKDFPIVGAVPSTVFEGSWFLRGFDQFLQDMVANRDFAEQIMDGVMAFNMEVALQTAALGADIVWLGDDVGVQNAMLISPDSWRELLKPRYAQIISELKRTNKNITVAFHTDGYIEPIIEDFVDIGLDILNSLQPNSNDLASIKKRYGRNLSFWGGIDVQHAIPFGTPMEVVREVRLRIEQMAAGGGFIICSSNGIEPSPRVIENIFTYYWALEKYGKYPLDAGSSPVMGRE